MWCVYCGITPVNQGLEQRTPTPTPTSPHTQVKQIEKLDVEAAADEEEQAALAEDEELPLKLLGGGELDGNIISLRDVGFRYPPTTPGVCGCGCGCGCVGVREGVCGGA